LIDALLRPPELGEAFVQHEVARLEAVVAVFEMCLPDQIDEVVVVERADHGLEEGRPLLCRLSRRQGGNRIEGELVRPQAVPRQEPRVAETDHRPAPAGRRNHYAAERTRATSGACRNDDTGRARQRIPLASARTSKSSCWRMASEEKRVPTWR